VKNGQQQNFERNENELKPQMEGVEIVVLK
jgi:hypothetical protein